ncbi:hypothetical protein GEMRC1_009999 [Eukaryota sp. GEM-RC1]
MSKIDLELQEYRHHQHTSSLAEKELMMIEDQNQRDWIAFQTKCESMEKKLMLEAENLRRRELRKRKSKLRRIQMGRIKELVTIRQMPKGKSSQDNDDDSDKEYERPQSKMIVPSIPEEKQQQILEQFKSRANTIARKKSVIEEEEKRKNDMTIELRNTVLIEGALFTKYSTRGTPGVRFVWFEQDLSSVCWRSTKSKTNDASSYLKFEEVTELKRGATTEVFQSQDRTKLRANCCFSLISEDRTLDLEAQDPLQAEDWCRSIESLLMERKRDLEGRKRSSTVGYRSNNRSNSTSRSRLATSFSVSSLH